MQFMSWDRLTRSRSSLPPRIEPTVQPVNGVVQPPVEPPPNRPGRRTNVLESLKGVLTNMWKLRCAYYFKHPVNAIQLCIPDYHRLIRHPMDLSTIKKRLQNNYYYQADEALEDFELIFENCMLYNLEGTEVHKAGEDLRNAFYTRLAGIDIGHEEELQLKAVGRKRKPDPPAKRKTYPMAKRARQKKPPKKVVRNVKNVRNFGSMETKVKPNSDSDSESATESAPRKRFVKPTLLFEWQDYLVEKAHSEYILNCLTKRKRFRISWPFNSSKLWPDYAQNANYDHAKEEKLDWEILKDKLANDKFDNFDDFANSIRVMFLNSLKCFPLDKFLVYSVNEANGIFESRVERCKVSIPEVKKGIKELAAQRIESYNLIIAKKLECIEENPSTVLKRQTIFKKSKESARYDHNSR